ncbi:hypothetical protein H0H87_007960 [Tephrocybe sp. NHM501043]|nr:hypothetical protein H0H87_007960 [Tephrocybe sp. NHM501043]
MPRPGPLQELPLDHFLPPSLAPASLKRTGDVLFSPAKRRILNEEGIYTPKSPLRTTPARFLDILAGPSSPAKILDFGSPKQASSSKLRATSVDPEIDDCFSQPSSSAPIPPSSFPRESPHPPDPQSIHYPGFTVYFDVDSDLDEAPSIAVLSGDKEVIKENLPPRRKTRKSATAPPETDPKSQLHSPPTKRRESERLKKAKSTPATPKAPLAGGSPTPRRSIYGQKAASPAKGSMRRRLATDEECAMA